MSELTVADILAACDVIDQIAESSDSLDFEQALAFKNAANILLGKVKTTIALLETQQIGVLDGQPRKVGGSVFTPKKEYKMRPDQGRLKSMAFGWVTHDPATGAKRKALTIAKAVDMTIDLMYELFVSPSQLPKQKGLDVLGMKQSDFCTPEHTGTKLVEIKVEDDHG